MRRKDEYEYRFAEYECEYEDDRGRAEYASTSHKGPRVKSLRVEVRVAPPDATSYRTRTQSRQGRHSYSYSMLP